MLEKIKILSGELDRMAPNMKAIERLEGVENRLHDTEKDFENSRKEAKKAKDKFQNVKDKRYVRYSCRVPHSGKLYANIYGSLQV